MALRRKIIPGSFCLHVIKQVPLAANEQFGSRRGHAGYLQPGGRERGAWGWALHGVRSHFLGMMAPLAERETGRVNTVSLRAGALPASISASFSGVQVDVSPGSPREAVCHSGSGAGPLCRGDHLSLASQEKRVGPGVFLHLGPGVFCFVLRSAEEIGVA